MILGVPLFKHIRVHLIFWDDNSNSNEQKNVSGLLSLELSHSLNQTKCILLLQCFMSMRSSTSDYLI